MFFTNFVRSQAFVPQTLIVIFKKQNIFLNLNSIQRGKGDLLKLSASFKALGRAV